MFLIPRSGAIRGGPARLCARGRGRRMLQALGVWDGIDAGAQPILDMVVTDSRLHDPCDRRS